MRSSLVNLLNINNCQSLDVFVRHTDKCVTKINLGREVESVFSLGTLTGKRSEESMILKATSILFRVM